MFVDQNFAHIETKMNPISRDKTRNGQLDFIDMKDVGAHYDYLENAPTPLSEIPTVPVESEYIELPPLKKTKERKHQTTKTTSIGMKQSRHYNRVTIKQLNEMRTFIHGGKMYHHKE